MHALFKSLSTASTGVLKFPEWYAVRDGLRRNLGQVIRYYRKNPMAVESSHFLVRLLHAVNIPQSQNLERYYDNVSALALNMAMALKMTSPIYRGEIFNGIFYGDGCPEILIAHDQPFDLETAHRNWEGVCAVQVLRHPRSDLGMNLPDGNNTGSETGLAVIAINIPLLAIQYRAFRYNEVYVVGETDTQRSVMQFIHMYVLPNMLMSHLDLTLFNRIDNLQKGAPLGMSRKHHSFMLADYTRQVNQIQTKVLIGLEKIGKDFTGILQSIPTVVRENMEMALVLPEIAPTRQVNWALSISRLNVLLFLMRTSKMGAGMRNQREVNQILRDIMAYKSNNIMRTYLPADLFHDIESEIDALVMEM